MISKYKYIIWDWNGTLLNDVWLCIEIMNEMLEKRNLPSITYDKYRTDQHSLNKMVSDFTVDTYFHKIIGQDNQLAIGKTEIGKQLIEEINIDPDKIVLIGDTTHDVEVAYALGIDCILLLNGHHSMPRLEMTGVKVVQELSNLIPN